MSIIPTTRYEFAPVPAHIRRRCHTLRLADADLERCRTIGDVKTLAKQTVPALLKHYHPDYLGQHGRHAPRGTFGATFRMILDAYQWLLALPPETPLRPRPRPSVPDYEPPFIATWDREPPLPWGWHEPRERLWTR